MGCSWATAFFHIILQKSQFWLMYNWTWLLPVLKVMLRVISNHLLLLNNIIVFTKKPRKKHSSGFHTIQPVSEFQRYQLGTFMSFALQNLRRPFLILAATSFWSERGVILNVFFLFYTQSHDIIVVIFAQLLDYNYTITIIVYDMVW